MRDRYFVNKIKDTDAAYIAGFIDGEGSIGLRTAHSNDGKTPNYTLRMRITNTNLEVLAWIQAIVRQGSIRKIKMYQFNKKQGYEIYWGGRVARNILVQIQPYLKVKALQAKIGIEFAKTIKSRGGVLMDDSLRKERDIFRTQMDTANASNKGGLNGKLS